MLEPLSHASFTADSPPDAQVRRAALNPSQSFAVSAPAGSGKTGLLTQRVLTLLAHCDEPEEVLAITFTRKAAGEMQDRILQALWQAAEEPQPEDPHQQLTWQLAQHVLLRDQTRNWQLLCSPQRLRVQTIDSLCRSITRQLPLASGLGAQPDTLEDSSTAYRLAVHELFTELEKETPLRHDLAQLLRHLDNNLSSVEKLLVALLAKREQWLHVLLQARSNHAREYLEATLQQVINEHLNLLHTHLQLHQSDVCAIADSAAQNLHRDAPADEGIAALLGITTLPGTDVKDVAQWKNIAELLLTKTGTYRARLTKNEGFPAGKEQASLKEKFGQLVNTLQECEPEFSNLLQAVRELPSPHYQDNQWQLLDSLTRLLPVLVAQLTLVFKQLGATDYSAISQAALMALGDEDAPSDIALQLDYRIRHILVDEFQDTAGPQLELLQKLTAGWQADDGRTLFIVGDGMQSCYGFRNANVGLFLDARRQGIGAMALQALDLNVNFRSQAGVVNWVNNTFLHAFPAADDIGRGAVKYSPSTAFKSALPDDAVKFFLCQYHNNDPQENTSDDDTSRGRIDALRREADTVVHLVQQAKTQDPNGKIAILVRTRSHLAQILPALSAANLRWQATDIDSLTSRMAIVDLMSLTRALLNPVDRIAWLALLRAPWCGLDLHDLHHIANTDLNEHSPRWHADDYPIIWQQLVHFESITALSTNGQRALTRLMNTLTLAWQARQRKPLRQWIEGIWLALGGPAILLDSDDHDNINSYFTLLEKHQEGGGIRDWHAFTLAVEKLYAAPKRDADANLHVMTIHKSKGLEFDTVIIPALDRRPRNDDHELLLWQERLDAQGERQLLLGPLAATGEQNSDLYRFMQSEKNKQQMYENTRLLYVGCTRAIKRLYLLACLQNKDEKISLPSKNSLLASIWKQVENQLSPLPTTSLDTVSNEQPHTDEKPGLQHILRLTSDWQLPLLSDTPLLAEYRGHEYHDDNNFPEAETRTNRLARHRGNIIHRALQVIVERKLAPQLTPQTHAQTLVEYLQQQTPFWKIQLRQLGWQGIELTQTIEKISRAVTQTLADTKGQWLLNHTHAQSACELALYQQETTRLRESIIDRTFVADGIRWIIDYKSSEPADNQTVEDFIAVEIAQYRPQLQRYHLCFSQIENHPLRCALYFPLLSEQRWVEVDC